MTDYLARFHAEALDRNTYVMVACVAAAYVGMLLVWWGQGR